MKKKPVIREIHTLNENRFIRLYDMEYEDGSHYYNASRKSKEDLCAVKEKPELPDAVSGYVALHCADGQDRLLLFYEYRYPTGQYVLSIPSGLIDPKDAETGDPAVCAVIREIREETGISLRETDKVHVLNPFVFNSPGMTDESTAIVAVEADVSHLKELSHAGAEGTEVFDGFRLATKEEALQLLRDGVDEYGIPYPFVTWGALMWFVNRQNRE